jgi:hypothetical protein
MRYYRHSQHNWAKKFIVGFGFLNGLWFAIGIDPQAALFKALVPAIALISPELAKWFIIIPTILTVLTFVYVLYRGKLLGALAVGMGFVGGFLISTSPVFGLIALAAGVFLSLFAFK